MMIDYMCSNCRGAGGRNFHRRVRASSGLGLLNQSNVDVLMLLETRISGRRADMVIRKLGFTHWIRVEACGYVGGIWLMWNEDSHRVEYLCSNEKLIHC